MIPDDRPPCNNFLPPAASIKFSLSVLTATKGHASKRLLADENGLPAKDHKHHLGIAAGTVEHTRVHGLEGLRELLARVQSNQAIIHGIPKASEPGARFTLLLAERYTGKPDTIARTKDCFDYPPDSRLTMFDYDPEPEASTTIDSAAGLMAIVSALLPAFVGAGWLQTVSTSSAIRSKETGDYLTPPAGMHVYLLVRGDVERFADILKGRLWLAGYGFCKLAAANQKTGVAAVLERSLIDTSVFSPERLDYVAGAIIDPAAPFWQDRPPPELHDGAVVDLDAIPDLTSTEKTQYRVLVDAEKTRLRPEREARAAHRIRQDKPDIPETDLKREVSARLARADKAELTPDHPLYFDNGKVVAAGDITSDMDGWTLADPQEPTYGRAKAKLWWNDGNPRINSKAHGMSKIYSIEGLSRTAGQELPPLSVYERVGGRTIAKAIEQTSEGYRPPRSASQAEAKTADSEQQQAREILTPDGVADLLNRKHALITNPQNMVLTETLHPDFGTYGINLRSPSNFRAQYCNQTIPVHTCDKIKHVTYGHVWLTHKNRRTYEGIGLYPGAVPDGFFNLFHGLNVEPQPGATDLYREHLFEVICNGTIAKFNDLWKWLAYSVQRLDELPGVAIVLRGEQGTGKGAFVKPFSEIFGAHYVELSQIGQLCGRFSGHLGGAIFVYANEAVWGGDKQGESALKSMITDGSLIMESKGKDAIQIRNHRRIIFSSNESWAIPRGVGDRRFFCVNVSSKHKNDIAYFKALRDEIDNGGAAALLHELLAVDLTGWHPRNGMVSNSADGEDMKIKGLSSPLGYWCECLQFGRNTPMQEKNGNPYSSYPPKDLWTLEVVKEDFYQAYKLWCKLNGKHVEDFTTFGKELTKAADFKTKRFNNAGLRQRAYIFPPLEEARRQFRGRIARIEFDSDE